jgi:hypothetical protein
MATIEAPHSRVLYSDGEGIVLSDMNDMQTRMMARLGDLFMGGYEHESTGEPERIWTSPGSGLCLVPRAGGAFPYAVSPTVNLTVGIFQGWVCQDNSGGPASPDGDDATVLSAFVPSNASFFTMATADGSNPRLDLIQMKLEEIDDDSVSRDYEDAVTRAKSSSSINTSRRVQATFSVKTGTPAADPSPPTPDSGYAQWAIIRVPTSATGLNYDDIFDMRFPMRIECQRIAPYAIGRPGTVPDWDRSGGNYIAIGKTAGTDKCYVFPHTGHLNGRIIGCFLNCLLLNTFAVKLVRFDDNSGTFLTQDIRDVTSEMGIVHNTAAWYMASNLKTGDVTTNDNDERPIWCNFFGPGGQYRQGLGHNSFYRVALEVDAFTASQIWEAGFYIATDL